MHSTATDPNGNYQEIGNATSDTNGNYAFSWVPPIPGTYHIKATFEGSKAYYDSDSTTYIVVKTATSTPAPTQTAASTIAATKSPTATPAPTTAAPEPRGGDQTAIYVAVAAVITIVIAAAVILRKRKQNLKPNSSFL